MIAKCLIDAASLGYAQGTIPLLRSSTFTLSPNQVGYSSTKVFLTATFRLWRQNTPTFVRRAKRDLKSSRGEPQDTNVAIYGDRNSPIQQSERNSADFEMLPKFPGATLLGPGWHFSQ